MKVTKQNKKQGKTEYSVKRRQTTRESGYHSHKNATGGKYKKSEATIYKDDLEIVFHFPKLIIQNKSSFKGFGFYFRSKGPVTLNSTSNNFSKRFYKTYEYPNWSKCGNIWNSSECDEEYIKISIKSAETEIEIYDPKCGYVTHKVFEDSKEAILKRLWEKAPEALFIEDSHNGGIEIKPNQISNKQSNITLKECNRCARFLPVNFDNERSTLSFSNHCVAKRPCKHKGFGILQNAETDEIKKLEFGFQLECRFCKSFFVNRPLNPKRTSSQMKEDGQRRRAFEFLIAELQNKSSQQSFRIETGKELTEYIFKKFNGSCFKCKKKFSQSNEMNIDHTRPLALLWPLDGSATALCRSCNSKKRDRYPKDFYSKNELQSLADITGIDIVDLLNPLPNIKILNEIIRRIDWFYDEFLNNHKLKEIKDGKTSASLICKSLDRVVSYLPKNIQLEMGISFLNEYKKRLS